jgi:hypothetical protein
MPSWTGPPGCCVLPRSQPEIQDHSVSPTDPASKAVPLGAHVDMYYTGVRRPGDVPEPLDPAAKVCCGNGVLSSQRPQQGDIINHSVSFCRIQQWPAMISGFKQDVGGLNFRDASIRVLGS